MDVDTAYNLLVTIKDNRDALEQVGSLIKPIINNLQSNSNTMLTNAAHDGYENIAKMLIDAQADVNIQSSCGYTALIMAARCNRETIVSMLLKAGAKMDLTTKDNETALIISAFYAIGAVTKILIEAGANLYIRDSAGKNAIDYIETRWAVGKTDVLNRIAEKQLITTQTPTEINATKENFGAVTELLRSNNVGFSVVGSKIVIEIK